jgi:hypothetical protein
MAFNTLLAIATPNLKVLQAPPTADYIARWQLSALAKSEKQLQVVWIARDYEKARESQIPYVGTVEAHSAGKRHECFNFIQTHPNVPRAARAVTRDMLALVKQMNVSGVTVETKALDVSWLVTNDIQDAFLEGGIDELPEGSFLLEAEQERVIIERPPLLLESRSGTGKTNVLFQHAIAYSQGTPVGTESPIFTKAICFVTVSSRLCQELQKRYELERHVRAATLPSIQFFSFEDLMNRMLQMYNIGDFEDRSLCAFQQYVGARKSHQKMKEEVALIENEIGGVIMGSLTVAQQQTPLTKAQYLKEIRSNVSLKSDKGKERRVEIHNEYKQYVTWKAENRRYDVNDVIVKLVGVAIGK